MEAVDRGFLDQKAEGVIAVVHAVFIFVGNVVSDLVVPRSVQGNAVFQVIGHIVDPVRIPGGAGVPEGGKEPRFNALRREIHEIVRGTDHPLVLVKGLVVNDVFVCPVAGAFRFIEHEIGGVVGHIPDGGEIPDADVQPDRAAVDRAAGIVECKGIVPVAVRSAAECRRFRTACACILADRTDEGILGNDTVLRMVVIAECFAVDALEIVVADDIIRPRYRNRHIGAVDTLIRPGPRCIIDAAEVHEAVVQHDVALAHDIDGAACVLVILEYKSLDPDIIASEQIEDVRQLILPAGDGILDTGIVVMLHLLFLPARILKPAGADVRRDRGAVKDILVLDDDLADVGGGFRTEYDHGILPAGFAGADVILDIGTGTNQNGGASRCLLGSLFDGAVGIVRGAVAGAVIAVLRDVERSGVRSPCPDRMHRPHALEYERRDQEQTHQESPVRPLPCSFVLHDCDFLSA